jgi:hypothetical protein
MVRAAHLWGGVQLVDAHLLGGVQLVDAALLRGSGPLWGCGTPWGCGLPLGCNGRGESTVREPKLLYGKARRSNAALRQSSMVLNGPETVRSGPFSKIRRGTLTVKCGYPPFLVRPF